MNRSKLPTIAKRILNKLNSCESKDIMLTVKGDKYEVIVYGADGKIDGGCSVGFNYSEKDLPT